MNGAEQRVLYTEPDKLEFFNNHLRYFLEKSAAQRGMILAARSPDAFATFPRCQQLTESIMNRLCANALNSSGDFCYGPMLIPGALLAHVPQLESSFGWGWRFFLMGLAHRRGIGVNLVEGPFECPINQRNEDDTRARSYRLLQLDQNTAGFAAAFKDPRP